MAHHYQPDSIRKCGIYCTSIPLPGKEDWVRGNLLVYFHNHSQQGPPLILLPDTNIKNRWKFYDKGYLVHYPQFIKSLIPLLPEGFYILTEALHWSSDEVLPAGSLVQLGYNRSAEPILFTAEFDSNAIYFPTHGTKVTTEIFSLLESPPFYIPESIENHH